MSESAMRLHVSIVDFEVGITLRTVIMSQLEDTRSRGPMRAVGESRRTVIGKKVEIKLVVWERKLVDLREPEKGIELDCGEHC